MVYNIAMCDDEKGTCASLEELTDKIFDSLSLPHSIDVFYSGEEFIKYLKQGNKYSFILLDIELYEINGITISKMIRESFSDYKVQIVFVSSKTMYAMELFQVAPLDFLVKPVNEKSLSDCFKKGLKIIDSVCECFEYDNKGKKIRLPYTDIIFFESSGRQIKMMTTSGVQTFYGRLGNLLEVLPKFFLQIHKSYLINMNAVQTIKPNEVYMNEGSLITIGRTYRDSVKKRFLERRFEQ